MSTPPNMTDAQAEVALRDILAPLDRAIDRGNVVLGLSLLALPGLFFLLWLAFGFRWWSALLGCLGALVATVCVGFWLEGALARRAARLFDRHFPPGTPQRTTAIHLLDQLETPNQASVKLRQQLPETLITRHQPADVHGQLAQAITPPDAPAPQSPRPAPPAAHTPSPSGRYDFIPLELPPPADEEKDRPGA